MSLARALTKRYRKDDSTSAVPLTPGRAASTRKFDRNFDRAQISLPIELLSTTNVLAFNAPDLHDLHEFNTPSPSSAASSSTSFDDSASSRAASSSSSISSPESPVRESSPVSVEPNHLSTYFDLPSRARSSVGSHRQSNDSIETYVPAVPSRAISHTKKTHQALARKRSQSRIRSPPTSVDASILSRSSLDMFSSKPEAHHPFGAELAQVNELAEEFGAQDISVWDEEEQFLMEHGLQKFTVDDYVNEIQGLFGGVFDDGSYPMIGAWI